MPSRPSAWYPICTAGSTRSESDSRSWATNARERPSGWSNHAGLTGSGFCNGDAVGAYAQFTVDAAQAGVATPAFRFANGQTRGAPRPANLVVNGSAVGTVSFESTGGWTAWTTKTLTASLNPGGNTVRLEPTTADGLPNLDRLDVRGPLAAHPDRPTQESA